MKLMSCKNQTFCYIIIFCFLTNPPFLFYAFLYYIAKDMWSLTLRITLPALTHSFSCLLQNLKTIILFFGTVDSRSPQFVISLRQQEIIIHLFIQSKVLQWVCGGKRFWGKYKQQTNNCGPLKIPILKFLQLTLQNVECWVRLIGVGRDGY